jgi:D-serine dehydratase
MRAFLGQAGAAICPHGKTTMSPELFALQIEDGAFGMTCATAGHLEIYRAAGVSRVIFANQLAGQQNLRMAMAHLRDPAFEFFCLVDSMEGAEALSRAAAEAGLARPVKVLIELGAVGARTGVRSAADAVALAKAIAELQALRVAGIETYEGVFGAEPIEAREARIASLLDEAAKAARTVAAALDPSDEPFLVTAGGSEFFDMVADCFGALDLGRDVKIILRGGCYLTNDSLYYARGFERLRQRSPTAAGIDGGLRSALEVWAVVQSRPEPSRAYCTVGKRDISYDFELPVPSQWYRPGRHERPQPVGRGMQVVGLNDQHLHLELEPQADLDVGDLIGFGVSHPCTTFDKWRLLMIVDEGYNVVDAVRTFF